jgi:hypothetical protein
MTEPTKKELWQGLWDATIWVNELAKRISPETHQVIEDSPRMEKLRDLINGY